jgi:hypothetical protein
MECATDRIRRSFRRCRDSRITAEARGLSLPQMALPMHHVKDEIAESSGRCPTRRQRSPVGVRCCVRAAGSCWSRLVGGRWVSRTTTTRPQDDNDKAQVPWAGGVRDVDLAARPDPLVQRIEVVPLTDPVFWGKEIVDERYLLVADL